MFCRYILVRDVTWVWTERYRLQGVVSYDRRDLLDSRCSTLGVIGSKFISIRAVRIVEFYIPPSPPCWYIMTFTHGSIGALRRNFTTIRIPWRTLLSYQCVRMPASTAPCCIHCNLCFLRVSGLLIPRLLLPSTAEGISHPSLVTVLASASSLILRYLQLLAQPRLFAVHTHANTCILFYLLDTKVTIFITCGRRYGMSKAVLRSIETCSTHILLISFHWPLIPCCWQSITLNTQ